MFKVNAELKPAETLMRDAYCGTLMELAKDDPRIVVLDADLVSSSGMKPFFKAYPDRAIQCGIAEANMIGVAAGLSLTGKVPFCHSFGPFASRRVCDQIYISAAYAKLNVRIVGSDPGVTAAYNGGTHMPFEDMAVLRGIPEITLLEPCDPVCLADLTKQLADVYGVYYIRMARKGSTAVYAPGSTFEIGKGNVLRPGVDVTIIASGIMVAEALKAAESLAAEGVSARASSRTRWPLPVPPTAGLQGMFPTASRLMVKMMVSMPSRAAARAASMPACPAPMTAISQLPASNAIVESSFLENGPILVCFTRNCKKNARISAVPSLTLAASGI